MYTAQDLLNQPIIIAVIALLFILTAVILFIVPTFSWFSDKIKTVVPSQAKKEPATAAPKKEKASIHININTKKSVYAVLMAAVIVVVAIGGWYTYVTFFPKDKGSLQQPIRPNKRLQYALVGYVKSVDHGKGELVVHDDFVNKDFTLKMNPLTKVFVDQNKVETTTLQTGQNVTVRSNADFAEEKVNIFEVSILQAGSPVPSGGTPEKELDYGKP